MSSVLDQMNLTPQERRFVFAAAGLVFIVLNYLLVWPHFSDLGRVRQQLAATRGTIATWNKEISNDDSATGYKTVLHQLERQQGGGIVNQQVQLQRSVSDQAIHTGVTFDEIRPVTAAHPDTNDFYAEQSVRISFESQEPQLISFLFNVGNDPAMIRVRELSLKTADANRYRLKGDAVLTANYAKAQPTAAKPGAAPAKAPVGAAPAKAPVRPRPVLPPNRQGGPILRKNL